MQSSVARMLLDSLKGRDPLDAEWFWEAGMVSAKEGTPLDIVIWDAVREIVEQFQPQLPQHAAGVTAKQKVERLI